MFIKLWKKPVNPKKLLIPINDSALAKWITPLNGHTEVSGVLHRDTQR